MYLIFLKFRILETLYIWLVNSFTTRHPICMFLNMFNELLNIFVAYLFKKNMKQHFLLRNMYLVCVVKQLVDVPFSRNIATYKCPSCRGRVEKKEWFRRQYRKRKVCFLLVRNGLRSQGEGGGGGVGGGGLILPLPTFL